MRRDICYPDNDTPSGKRKECDREILAELNALVPKLRRKKGGYTAGTKYHWIETLNWTGYTLEQSTGEWTPQTNTETIWETYCIR